MRSSDPTEPLRRLHLAAARRHGVITSTDVDESGVSRGVLRAQVERGILTRVHRGVFVATAHPATWHQRVAVAVAVHRGVASHRCAARLQAIDGFDKAPIELTVERGRRCHDPTVVLHYARAPLAASMITVVGGIPTTSAARTLADLGAVVSDDAVEQALDDLLRRGFNQRWLSETLGDSLRPGLTGCGALVRVLSKPDRGGPMPDSVFERILTDALAAAGITGVERQIAVTGPDGKVFARIDAGLRGRRIGIEADSEMWHWGPRRGRSARLRHNRLMAEGWQMIYASWQDAQNPAELIATIRSAMAESATTGRSAPPVDRR